MKILVFGATGKTGILVTQLLLENNHTVSAYVRNPNKLNLRLPNLQIIEGSIEDTKKMTETMMGHDAVISCIGSPSLRTAPGQHDFGKHISSAMKACSIKRIIYMASAGVHREIKGIPGIIAQLVLKNVLIDHTAAIAYFMTKDFDYTILRPMQLTNGPLTQRYKVSYHGVPGYKWISRFDVAYCIVDTVQHNKYINESIGLSGK